MPPALAADLALHYEAIGRHDLAQNLAAGLTDDDGREAGSVRVFITLRGDAPDSATDLARSVAHAQDKSAPSQNNFGITRLRAGDPEGARKAFLNAIALDPALPGPYYNLAILEKFYMLDDDAAAGWFKLYRQRASDDPDGLAQVFETNTTKPIAADKGDAR
jgi:tetratricopeptide (TPR) repeat protein